MSGQSLHSRIMNIPVPRGEEGQVIGWSPAWIQGHTVARHAAAELSLEADALRDELLKALKSLAWAFEVSIHDHQDSGAYNAALAAIAKAEGKP